MKIIRFCHKKKEHWGVLKGEEVCVLKEPPFKRVIKTKQKLSSKDIKLLAPSLPSKIVLVGLNYRDHAEEMSMQIPDEPIIFLKPPTAVLAPQAAVIYPKGVTRLDYEAELALVIKKTARHIKESEVSRYILGFTCLNDVTARDLQKKDGQWTRAKSFDTFCPVGPWIETKFDPENVAIRTFVNGEKRQDSTTGQFIFKVPYLVSFISSIMTLYEGDIISTGTPKGVGPMNVGDTVQIGIEGIGVLENRIIA
jgi:2-keto-4-pentenoate hydratase/2-oxohepta-3-ene-1,7-dioic acid hydratase in catechol pathway